MEPQYIILDTQTGRYVSRPYSYKDRNKARARADRLDMEYGAFRYKVIPLMGDA